MGLGSWLRSLFAPISPDDEAAEREEYGLLDETALERQEHRAGFLSKRGSEAAEHEPEEFPDDRS
jgi:hypothetical protein